MATKKVAKKANKKTDNKFDFSDSVKAIKASAKTVNKEVKEVAEELVDDIRDNSGQLRTVAIKTVQGAYNKAMDNVSDVVETVSEKVNMKNIAATTKSINQYTLKTAEDFVDGAIVSSEKWHGVASKAVKGGLKLAAKQQVLVFDTLDNVKGQLTDSALRLKKLFN